MQQKQIRPSVFQFVQVNDFFGKLLRRVDVRFGLYPQYLTRPVPFSQFQFRVEIHVANDDDAVVPSSAGVQHAEDTVAVGSTAS